MAQCPLAYFDHGCGLGSRRVDEGDGGRGVAAGAVAAGFLDAAGAAPASFYDAGAGALAPLAAVAGGVMPAVT